MTNRPTEYDKPAERLMVALEGKSARLQREADALDVVAARLRSEAVRSGELARAYGTLPARRLRPLPGQSDRRTRERRRPCHEQGRRRTDRKAS